MGVWNLLCLRKWTMLLLFVSCGSFVLSQGEESLPLHSFSSSSARKEHYRNLRTRGENSNPVVHTNIGEDSSDLYIQDQIGRRNLGSIDEILRVSFDLNERIARTRDPDCHAHKRLIFTPSNGIGNRLLAVVSAVMLAMMSDRVFELNWKETKDCGHSYHQLFHPLKESHTLRVFIPDTQMTSRLPNIVTRNETKCELDLERKDNLHFYFLKDKQLFERMNDECHIIFMRYNHYFANLLARPELGPTSFRVKEYFPSPFNQISNVIFRPHVSFVTKAQKFIEEKFQGKKWMSIHARGFYDQGSNTNRMLQCANKLLESGEISHIFFSTDSERLRNISHSTIAKKGALVEWTEDKTYVDDVVNGVNLRKDSHSIRNETDIALIEWYIIGEADFCMSATMGDSTFSKTSVLRGKCKFIQNSHTGDCELSKAVADKDIYINSSKSSIDKLPDLIDDTERDHIWSTIKHETRLFDEQCFESYVYQTLNPITQYWQQHDVI